MLLLWPSSWAWAVGTGGESSERAGEHGSKRPRGVSYLICARLTPGQLGDGDGHEDHEEAGGEVLVVRLALGCLAEGRQEARVHLGEGEDGGEGD